MKIYKIKTLINNLIQPKVKGEYIEVLIYSLTIFLYSIFNNHFVSWWGIGLKIIQIRIITIISFCISIILIYKLYFGLVYIKNNTLRNSVYFLIFKIFSIWLIILILYLLKILKIIIIHNYIILFFIISFVLYLEKIKDKINELLR